MPVNTTQAAAQIMSHAGSQAWAFYREVARTRLLWTIRDEGGFPAPKNAQGKRAIPFWSSQSRAERIIKSVPAYSGFTPLELAWDDFRSSWVPNLMADGHLVGVNWSGKKALGFDLEPERLARSVQALIDNPE